ncbi:MAG: ATPase with chaperone activity [Methylibium sp.]|uniref:ATPase with chaperone activity n=1 Tax=Methylibium sp. TaxID=2067992 RepID=UPI0018555003|nr:ATPase with chaperone activity [Methylibium sp.]MBA3598527.1 ATPase with chaperone activity [Methylibium sp.]
MFDDNDILIPDSFMQLYLLPGRHKPSALREVIEQRYELCEDLAQMLSETARTTASLLGITEADVLERIHKGLLSGDLELSAAECMWVVRRLAELLDWDVAAVLDRLAEGA